MWHLFIIFFCKNRIRGTGYLNNIHTCTILYMEIVNLNENIAIETKASLVASKLFLNATLFGKVEVITILTRCIKLINRRK